MSNLVGIFTYRGMHVEERNNRYRTKVSESSRETFDFRIAGMEIVANRRPLAKDSTRSPTIAIIIRFGIGVLLYCDAGFDAGGSRLFHQCEASKQRTSRQG